ncbi:uncharacterized protein [Diadema antillarum]|uniref:uncharacterized protein n=1 Tax=Diadema antillarum TaxID=105358 RepID=UPI003A84D30C
MPGSGRLQLLDTKQVLGEHLFSKVTELHPEKADRITGMLLEAENEDIMKMLEDDSLLRRRIEGALRVMQEQDNICGGGGDREKYGEELYSLISEIEPIQCAKITGMLLELDVPLIRHLLSSPPDLRGAVQKAMATLRADGGQREELGEKLYRIVAGRYDADSAAKITGMLLEMQDAQLTRTMQDPSLLEDKIRLAEEALSRQQQAR